MTKKNQYFAAYCSIIAAYSVRLLHIMNFLFNQFKTSNLLVNIHVLSYSFQKFKLFYICCSCSCILQHTGRFCCILQKSKIMNPILLKFNLGMGFRLYNMLGGVLPQKCSILLHTAAQCCIPAKIAAYHKTPLKKL